MSRAPLFLLPLCRASTLAVALGLVACADKSEAPSAAQSPVGAVKAEAAARQVAQQQAGALAALSTDDLASRGRQALREQRIHTPAGSNAMEIYIALRNKSAKPNPTAESALMDLQPYAVIATEQAITRGDFIEAERLRNLIAAADPLAPSLARIADSIAMGKRAQAAQSSQDSGFAAEQAIAARALELKTAQMAATTKSLPSKLVPMPSTPAPAARAAAPPPAAVAAATPPPPPAPVDPAPARSNSQLIALSSPQPEYPREAQRSRAVASVVASFTVNADGSVSNIETAGAGPNRFAFERSVQAALKRWKYQPLSGSQDVTRSFNFAP